MVKQKIPIIGIELDFRLWCGQLESLYAGIRTYFPHKHLRQAYMYKPESYEVED